MFPRIGNRFGCKSKCEMNYINCTDTLFPLSLPPIVDLKQVTQLSACEVLIWINVFFFVSQLWLIFKFEL